MRLSWLIHMVEPDPFFTRKEMKAQRILNTLPNMTQLGGQSQAFGPCSVVQQFRNSNSLFYSSAPAMCQALCLALEI